MVTADDIMARLATVYDPELPMMSVIDLGIARRVERRDEQWRVVITPTFSGCPAMTAIRQNIRQALQDDAVGRFELVVELSPPWRSSDVTARGRDLLRANGIAFAEDGARCPRCDSADVISIAEYGSVACKSFARCLACKEPFEIFKQHG